VLQRHQQLLQAVTACDSTPNPAHLNGCDLHVQLVNTIAELNQVLRVSEHVLRAVLHHRFFRGG
jgi:hypothetical protein